jgi:CheY-like chemotaxis protein
VTVEIGALIVDDQEDIRLLMRLLIDAANEGLFVRGEAASGPEALDNIDALDPDVVVLDQMMPGMSGLEAAAIISRRRPGQRMILCSAYLDDDLHHRAEQAGFTVIMTKGDIDQIAEALREAFAIR